MNFDDYYMSIALQEAKKAFTQKEIPVGCVIILRSTKEILAQTHNLVEQKMLSFAHAEMLAIEIASKKLGSKSLSDCDLYVTLEPCAMCAAAIAAARIGRLYYAASDEKQGAVENGVKFFSSASCHHHPEIYANIMAEESRDLILRFFRSLRQV